MKIYVAQYQPGRVGGGWTFTDHFVSGLFKHITVDYDEADVFFIPSPSMLQRDEVVKAKLDGKKIVLRIDNAVRNSRNRNTGMSRMQDFAEIADLVIYQSEWARDYLVPFTEKPGHVILNGTNLEQYPDQLERTKDHILYSRFNRDETKNWEVARYWYSQYQLSHPDATLHIVGQFSDELRQSNFDFYNGEQFHYYGVVVPDSLSRLYRLSNLLYTYYNDACSNTLIEALVSGCEVVGDEYYRQTGGAGEIIRAFLREGREYFSHHRMCADYLKLFEEEL